MGKLNALIAKAARLSRSEFRIEPTSEGAIVHFADGHRRTIRVQQQEEHYGLGSVVLGAVRVEELGKSSILPLLWKRNRETPVVGFRIDKHGRVVGTIDHPVEGLDLAELQFFIEALARECDSLSYVLIGRGMIDSD